jgi:hypothetical protein
MSWNNALPANFVFPYTLETLPRPSNYNKVPYETRRTLDGYISVFTANGLFIGFIKCETEEQREVAIRGVEGINAFYAKKK